jgi:hypothetical protein
MTARWSPDDSADLDAQVRALRSAERADVSFAARMSTKLGLSDKGRGEATDDDMQRRRAAEEYLRRTTDDRWPKPKQKPSGRWKAQVRIDGKYHTGTFDTEAQAEAFIRQVKEQH